jgi:DNA-binding transcriptional ArsR family regulator
MSQEEKLDRIIQLLRGIDEKLEALDELKTITKVGQKDSIETAKTKMFDKSILRKQIFNLCDGNHTVSQIASELNKSLPLISQNLYKLQDSGLIREIRKGKNKYYKKTV